MKSIDWKKLAPYLVALAVFIGFAVLYCSPILSGKVVYAGSGLRGYGNLVIVQHNSTFLTAYGHNQSLMVNEGQTVKRGQIIAKMGNTDAPRNQLHFEVRQNGKPVNPATYVPL